MEAAQFIAEYYRRQDLRFPEWAAWLDRPLADMQQRSDVARAVHGYQALLPADKDASILDIGFGDGWFIAVALALGYTNIEAADFGASTRQGLRNWSPAVREIHNIEIDIATFLATKRDRYDFIHLSHVIEHIPKYDLFPNVDAIYAALRREGTLMLRTPNMEGPRPVASRYVVLTHESGFTGTSLSALLQFCNFDNVTIVELDRGRLSFRQRIVELVRGAFLALNRFQHRLFGALNIGRQYSEELVCTAQRLDRIPLAEETRA